MSTTPDRRLYFAYGSNLHRADMRSRCPDARPWMAARLDGWRLTFRGVADIEPAAGRAVSGALWWLSKDDVCALDAYEGAPSNYCQRTVEVQTAEGPRKAMTYVMVRDSYRGLPSRWYLAGIEQGYRDWGLPVSELRRTHQETREALAALGVESYRRDGRKRLRAVLDAGTPREQAPALPSPHWTG